MALRYGSRPSEILGVRDSWLAYQVDVASLLLGRRVEALTQDGKMSAEAALASLTPDPALTPNPSPDLRVRRGEIGRGEQVRGPASGFRSLAGPGIVKMKIPDSGIW